VSALLDPLETLIDDFDVTADHGPITLTRRAQPTQNARGSFEASAPTIYSLAPVAVHTVAGRDLDRVPEADRTSEIREFYARAGSFPFDPPGFRVADAAGAADVLGWDGRSWRVVTAYDYQPQANAWIAMAALVDLQAVPA
jgi:hypothetical protein